MAFSQWNREAAQAVLDSTRDQPGPILFSLQALQHKFGFIHSEDVALVAQACNVSRADVHGVLTYYHDLRTTPPAKNTIRICVAEACQAVGARELVVDIERAHGSKMGESNSTMEIIAEYCLGNCALGPASMVNGELLGRSSLSKIDNALKKSDR